MKLPKSPLTYPGGKYRAVRSIAPFVPRDTKEICSPFFGGGSLEIYWASRGIKVHGYDVFDPLIDFWWGLTQHKQEMLNVVESYYPSLSKDMFYNLQKNYGSIQDRLERAAIYFVLNKSSFSGLTFSGGMSPNLRDFNPKVIGYLRDFDVKNFSVEKMSFHQSILKHNDALLYLDPPYLIKSHLYGHQGSTHKDFDHDGLVSLLKSRDNWLLSYNDCEAVQDMYSDFCITYPTWKYGMSKEKGSNEILILSPAIAEHARDSGLFRRYHKKDDINMTEQMSLF